MNRLWWSTIGGSGAVSGMLVVKPAFQQSTGLGISAIIVLLAIVLWLAATIVPAEKV